MSDTDGTPEVTRGVTTPDLLDRLIRGAIAERLRSGIPASVQRYDASKQQVDVQVLIKDFYRDEEGNISVASVPQITSIPVAFLSSTGGVYQISTPIAVGDIGWLKFADRSLDAWQSSQGQEVDPSIYSRFSLTDAVWTPGGLPANAPLSNVPTNVMLVGKGAAERIEIGAGYVACGGDAASCKLIVLDGDSVNAGTLTGTVLVSGAPVAVQFTYTPVVGLPVGPSPTASLTGGKASSSATIAKGK